jgi:probable F420-dependent oxidoreductase
MGKPRPFRFACGAYQDIHSRDHFIATIRQIEDMGYDTVLMSDHFSHSDRVAPLVAMMAAADATPSLRVGSYVFDNDFRHPVVLAAEAATLDLLSNGRFDLGLGAGWAEADYAKTGIPFDSPGVRVSRMMEAVQVMKAYFGDSPISFSGRYYTVNGLNGYPKPVQRPHPPLMIGGGGRRLLTFAAREANIISLLVPSHASQLPIAEGSTPAVAERIQWVREAAGERFAELELNIFHRDVLITDNRRQGAEQLAAKHGLTVDQVLDNIYILVGSVSQIVEDLQRRREQLGISYIAVHEAFRETFAPMIARLAGT